MPHYQDPQAEIEEDTREKNRGGNVIFGSFPFLDLYQVSIYKLSTYLLRVVDKQTQNTTNQIDIFLLLITVQYICETRDIISAIFFSLSI